MDTKKKIDNIIWNIETNRRVLGDTEMLDAVFESLKNLSKQINELDILKEQFYKSKM
jgi:hypothetical protein